MGQRERPSATKSGTYAIRHRCRPWPAYRADAPARGAIRPRIREPTLSATGVGHGRPI